MELHPALIFLGGLVVVLVGAEMLLRGAARIAGLLGLKPIIIGLTIVSVSTSAPELAVGIAATSEGRGPLAVGNIAGTNIFNILFILGLSAAIRPLPLQLQSIKLHVPMMIATAIILLLMAWDGALNRADGLILIAFAAAYTVALVLLSRQESIAMRREYSQEYGEAASLPRLDAGLRATRLGHGIWNSTLLAVGIAMTVLGAQLLVSGAIDLAKAYGVSDAFVGLTIVAIGTSAPELATTLVATYKDDRDVAIGNLIGSSIYNVLVILGLTCALSPESILVSRGVLLIDLPLAALVAIVCLPVFRTDRMVSRREGLTFVTAYVIYLGSLLIMRP